MAGGRGKRIGGTVEKPLTPFLGKTLIDRVAAALESAARVSSVYVVTSTNTPETEKKCLQEGWRLIKTDGKGYHEDLKQAILAARLACPVLIVSSDLPALTGKFLDKIIEAYENSKTDALTVLVPLERRERLKLSVSPTYQYMDKSYAVSGINLVDGAKIQDEKLGECAVVTDEVEAVLNVNTLEDLGIAEEIVRKQKLKRGFNAPN